MRAIRFNHDRAPRQFKLDTHPLALAGADHASKFGLCGKWPFATRRCGFGQDGLAKLALSLGRRIEGVSHEFGVPLNVHHFVGPLVPATPLVGDGLLHAGLEGLQPHRLRKLGFAKGPVIRFDRLLDLSVSQALGGKGAESITIAQEVPAGGSTQFGPLAVGYADQQLASILCQATDGEIVHAGAEPAPN